MIVKVCGMRDAENIRQLEALGIDWMGMIFWPKSKRYVSMPPVYLPQHMRKVGVFVDASLDAIRQHVEDYHLDIVQLHGQESPETLKALKPLTLIKALNIATPEDLQKTEPYEGLADYFLFDTKGESVGGNGEKFDWSVLDNYQGKTPFLLSGGIGSEDAEVVKTFHHPKCIGIDLNSRFETEPGLKDITKLKQFLEAIRYE